MFYFGVWHILLFSSMTFLVPCDLRSVGLHSVPLQIYYKNYSFHVCREVFNPRSLEEEKKVTRTLEGGRRGVNRGVREVGTVGKIPGCQPEGPGFNPWPGRGVNFWRPFFVTPSVDRDVKPLV